MTDTVLDRLVAVLDEALRFDANVVEPPVALLWPDRAGQWSGAIGALRERRPVVTLGEYAPEAGSGPALWVRCVVAGTVHLDGPEGVPVVYLPGVSRQELREVRAASRWLAPLASLQYRSQWFTQPSGKDWTVRALLGNGDRGLGLSVAGDEATAEALVGGLERLVREPIARLQGRHIDALFVHSLLNPDPVRLLLGWIDNPTVAREELSEQEWEAFVAQCRGEFGFDPEADGVVAAARRLGLAEGAWGQVWRRFREAPSEYPAIPERLREGRPQELFVGSSLAWPQDNEAAEDQLRSQLRDLRALTPEGARKELVSLNGEHQPRRGSVWAQLGGAPLASALEHLVTLAELAAVPLGGQTVDEIAARYGDEGWRVDLAALAALGEVDQPEDVEAVAAALDMVYRPWLDTGARALQAAVGPAANSGNYVAAPAPQPAAGEVLVFVDGLRLDVAHLLVERLEEARAQVSVEVGLAALPTVTQTAKPVLVPVDRSGLAAGEELHACRASDGVPADVRVLRSMLAEAGVQVLGPSEVGDPTGCAWTEAGEVDHKGHDLGVGLARELPAEVSRIARRVLGLLEAGWSTVTVVTDHGWLLLPSGLPKNDGLPAAATLVKKGRCARVKEGADVDVPTVPWYWDPDVQIAAAPGISCFEANQVYEHGGVSPQECVVPRLRVSTPAAVTTRAQITSLKWRGLTLVVEFADLPDGATVDLRRHAGDPASSIATRGHLTGGTGKVILLVEDDDYEGETAQLVVVASDGTILLQRETTVGQNR